MKNINRIRVVYRNRLFYWIRALLPKAIILQRFIHGSWRAEAYIVGLTYIVKCKALRPVRLRDSIFFSYVINRER